MRKRYSAEQIIGLLRQADMKPGKGRKVSEICKAIGVHDGTYYRRYLRPVAQIS